MFVMCQLKFEHLNMRKPMALPINVLCDVCDVSIKNWAFEHEKTNGTANKCLCDVCDSQLKFEHLNMRKLMALSVNVLCDVCDLSIQIWAFEHEKTNGIANKYLVWWLWFVNSNLSIWTWENQWHCQ